MDSADFKSKIGSNVYSALEVYMLIKGAVDDMVLAAKKFCVDENGAMVQMK